MNGKEDRIISNKANDNLMLIRNFVSESKKSSISILKVDLINEINFISSTKLLKNLQLLLL